MAVAERQLRNSDRQICGRIKLDLIPLSVQLYDGLYNVRVLSILDHIVDPTEQSNCSANWCGRRRRLADLGLHEHNILSSSSNTTNACYQVKERYLQLCCASGSVVGTHGGTLEWVYVCIAWSPGRGCAMPVVLLPQLRSSAELANI